MLSLILSMAVVTAKRQMVFLYCLADVVANDVADV